MKRLMPMLVAIAMVAIGSTSRMLAHEGHDHKVMGTVTMAAADHVMLKDTDGKNVTIRVVKDTKVKSKPVMKVEDIKAGTRIVVTATMDKNKALTAKTIEVGVVTAGTK